MSILGVSFMAKPVNNITKKATEKAEALKTTDLKFYRDSDIKSYLDSRQQVIKEEFAQGAKDVQSYLASRQQVIKEEANTSAEKKIAEDYKRAHGIE